MKLRILACFMIFSVSALGQSVEDVVEKAAVPSERSKVSVTEKPDVLEEKAKEGKVQKAVKTIVSPVEKNNLKPRDEKNVSKEKIVSTKRQKVVRAKEVKKEEPSVNNKVFLELQDGNFKYRRIPGIILTENRASSMDDGDHERSIADDIDAESLFNDSRKKDKKGFWFFGRSLSDLVAKGMILLLILLIFFLYRSRNRGSSGKRSKRKVLNSYRK